MKIIHSADLHLGSKIEAKLKPISEQRKIEVRDSFMRLVDYAEENGINVILLSGDVFDSDNPKKKDKDTFYSLIKEHPDIDFLYLRGNHDTEEANNESLPNLKTFSSEWRTYSYGEIDISGIEMTKDNAMSYYSTLLLNKDKTNIVMLHGQLSESVGMDKIKLSKLRDKNIDYLALGHIHSYSEGEIDNRGHYAYSGCLEGRGFDETGDKGFILLDVENGEVRSEFIKFCSRAIKEEIIDVTSSKTIPEILKRIKENVKFNSKDIYRITLIGDVPLDLEFDEKDIEMHLRNEAYFINVKNETLPLIDPNEFKNDLSLKGEFVRMVSGDEKLSEEEKRKIISLGLKTLMGREAKL